MIFAIMLRTFFTSVLMFLILSTLGQNQKELLLEDAKLKMSDHDFEAAIKSFSLIIAIDSTDETVYLNRGKCYEALKKPQSAYNDYTKSIVLNPFYSKSYFQRGNILFSTRDFVNSIGDFNLAMKYAEHDSLKYKYAGARATSYIRIRNFTSAESDLLYRLAFDSLNAETLNDLSLVENELGKKKQAYHHLNKLISIDKNNALAYANIGYYNLADSNYKEAIINLNRAIRIDSTFSSAYNNRGFCKMQEGDLDGAVIDIKQSIKLNNQNAYAFKNLALVLAKKGETKKACKNFEEALKLHYIEQFGNDILALMSKYCN